MEIFHVLVLQDMFELLYTSLSIGIFESGWFYMARRALLPFRILFFIKNYIFFRYYFYRFICSNHYVSIGSWYVIDGRSFYHF